MDGYIIETSALSVYLDPTREKHGAARRMIDGVDSRATKFVSVVGLAELHFGVKLAEVLGGLSRTALEGYLQAAQAYAVLEVTHHTADAYAELKTILAAKYLAKANRQDRPRWIEDWINRNTGQRLQVDENDLWMCAQAKERDLVLITADSGIERIADADPEVRLLLIS